MYNFLPGTVDRLPVPHYLSAHVLEVLATILSYSLVLPGKIHIRAGGIVPISSEYSG